MSDQNEKVSVGEMVAALTRSIESLQGGLPGYIFDDTRLRAAQNYILAATKEIADRDAQIAERDDRIAVLASDFEEIQRAGYLSQEVAADCINALDVAGMGKSGKGNTLACMVEEACAQIAELSGQFTLEWQATKFYNRLTHYRRARQSDQEQIATLTRQLATARETLARIESIDCRVIGCESCREFVRDEARRAHAAIDAPATAASTHSTLCCIDCRMPYGGEGWLDLTIPDEQWALIVGDAGGILCANCIVRRASKLPGAQAVRARIDFGETLPPPSCLWPECGQPESARRHRVCERRLDVSNQNLFCDDGACHPFTTGSPRESFSVKPFTAEEARAVAEYPTKGNPQQVATTLRRYAELLAAKEPA